MDHDELFNLHQLFFTGEYDKVLELSNSDYSEENAVTVDYYKVRSLVFLNKLNKVDEIVKGKQDITYKALSAFSKLNDKADDKFEDLVSKNTSNSIINRLGALYFIKLNEFEKAIQILEFNESLEKFLILVEIYLYNNDFKKSEIVLKSTNNENDEIILNFAENLINSVKNNNEFLRSSLYFFEELAHQHPTLLTLNGLFVINLQLNQIPEAEIVLNQLVDLELVNDDFLANQIAYFQLKNDSKSVELKRNELIKLNKNHQSVLDYNSKNELFDSIVEKYKEQIN